MNLFPAPVLLGPALRALGLHLFPTHLLLGYALLPLPLQRFTAWGTRRRWGTRGLQACASRVLLHLPGAFGLYLFPAFCLLGFALFPLFVHRLVTGRTWRCCGTRGLLTCCGRMLLHPLCALGLHLLPAFFLFGFLLLPLFGLLSFALFPLLLHLFATRYGRYRRNSSLARCARWCRRLTQCRRWRRRFRRLTQCRRWRRRYGRLARWRRWHRG